MNERRKIRLNYIRILNSKTIEEDTQTRGFELSNIEFEIPKLEDII